MSGFMGSVRAGILALLFQPALSLGFAGASTAAEPLKGVALVVGQSDYEHLEKLPNPARDARQIEELLNRLGLDTDMVEDRDARRLRRDFDGFLEDAEGADVALVYYSGHGIEAGGENFLLPIDTDLDAASLAGEKFISLEEILGELRRKAKITIFLLDACRTNPFPPGTVLQKDGDDEPDEISASGLGAPRGAVSLIAPNSDTGESLGIVIGYAASPGEAALDGPEGSTSPYAAALLKHLGANDFDFADVMTMVSEEVYLSTHNRQQPWTNASLRRLLYFGNAVEHDDGDEALIRGARRELLLTIATEPPERRSLVEALSENDAVPLDALYGMLKELNVDTAAGPDELAKQLKAGAENLRRFMDQKIGDAARNDPELTRYAALADQAQAEGALALSRQFRERASARADELSDSLDRRQEELKADRLEIAATYAEEAQSALLAFDPLRAAQRYRDAYEQVKRWDERLAWRYKSDEGFALADYGDDQGDRPTIQAAIEAHATALKLVSKAGSPVEWATNKYGMGIALSYLARIGKGVETLDEAVAAFDEALEVRTREAYPDEWAATQLAIGNAAMTYGHIYGDSNWLQRSADAYRQAADIMQDRVYSWTNTQRNLGLALYLQGYYTNDPAVLRQSVEAYNRVLGNWTKEEQPQEWALTEGNRAESLLALATLEPDSDYHQQGLKAIRDALAILDRQRSPMDWAIAQHYLGDAELTVAKQTQAPDDLRKAIRAFEGALEVWTRDRAPTDWATASTRMAEGMELLGIVTNDRKLVEQARDLTAEARQILTGAGYEHNDSYFANRLANIDATLQGMK
jgi:uncharacterized caspase-like protein